ncbi:putative abhydrolase domain-containing protein, partial [Smittium culicis]
APVVEQAAPVVEQAAPVVEQAAPVVEQAAPVVEQAAPVVEQAAPVVEQAVPEQVSTPATNNDSSFEFVSESVSNNNLNSQEIHSTSDTTNQAINSGSLISNFDRTITEISNSANKQTPEQHTIDPVEEDLVKNSVSAAIEMNKLNEEKKNYTFFKSKNNSGKKSKSSCIVM